MSESKRGIAPELLISQVENTAPFLFAHGAPKAEYIGLFLFLKNKVLEEKAKLTHEEYFTLCLCAHFITVATYVPTDVDNQIRQKLWDQKLPEGTSEQMAELVLASKNWNFLAMTTRFIKSPNTKEAISGHDGEWFSVAVGAYAVHRKKNPALAEKIQKAIFQECEREAEIFSSLKKARDGVGLLVASYLIAHNLGDLDRVIDQWNLPQGDPLRQQVYKLGHTEKYPWSKVLIEAGNLNKSIMASENHRHYPLRSPKSLRQSHSFLLPAGPFFDAWGESIGSSTLLSENELAEIVEALVDGFHRLSSPKIPQYGYARALGGIVKGFGGAKKLSLLLPVKLGKTIMEGGIPRLYQVPQKQFEEQWARKALQFLNLN